MHPLRAVLPALVVALTACAPQSDAPIIVPTEPDAVTANQLLDRADALVAHIEEADALFDRTGDAPLDEEEKQRLLAIYAPLVDYLTVMDGIRGQYRSGADAYVSGEAPDRKDSVALAFAMRGGVAKLLLAFVSRTTGKPMFEKLLDEAHPSWGVREGLFSRLQKRVLDPRSAQEMRDFSRRHLEPAYPSVNEPPRPGETPFQELARRAHRYTDEVSDRLRRDGAKLRWLNTQQDVKDAVFGAILPAQTVISRWMGDTRYVAPRPPLVSNTQVDAIAARMRPGDVFVARRNWYVSNVGLPGFWPHSGMWLGTPEDLAAEFDADPEVRSAYPNGFTFALATRYPDVWAAHGAPADDAHLGGRHVVLEAISEGVVLSSQYHGLGADHLAVLRPKLSKLERARAIERAYRTLGTPYDFEFDFATDNVLVCTELVYKSYQAPEDEGESLHFTLEDIVGRTTLPANRIIERWAKTVGTDEAQLEFVGFIDGHEGSKSSAEKSEEALLESWQRPKWDWSQE